METGLAGKRVLVTGGTRGIGRTLVYALGDAGAEVVTCCRYDSGRPPEQVHPRARVEFADVTRPAEVTALLDSCRRTLGGLDALVNNVGVNRDTVIDALSDPEWSHVIDHNVTSAHIVTQAALPLLADGASVVNIGAAAVSGGRPGGSHYAASKAALIGMTRSLARELGPRRIRINTVSPGLISAAGGTREVVMRQVLEMTPLGRLCQPEDVVGAVLFLLGDTSRFISGITLNVDGGI